ncbi:MAG: hypothetical protein WCK89_21395 [bacterium]
MLMITAVVVLYALAALCFKKQLSNWKAGQKVYAVAQKKLQDENALIAAKDEWTAKYAQMNDLMPIFPYDKDVDTYWLNIMDSAATRNGFTITRRQTNKEAEVGDVYELPIDCKDWEGTLESLVQFLYDLNKEGAMLDVRQLFIKPSNKPGYLKGSFTLYCAYMRGDVEMRPAAADTPSVLNASAAPASETEPADSVIAVEPAADEGETRERTTPPAETRPGEGSLPAPVAPQTGTNG